MFHCGINFQYFLSILFLTPHFKPNTTHLFSPMIYKLIKFSIYCHNGNFWKAEILIIPLSFAVISQALFLELIEIYFKPCK